jgi:hypothetical protein
MKVRSISLAVLLVLVTACSDGGGQSNPPDSSASPSTTVPVVSSPSSTSSITTTTVEASTSNATPATDVATTPPTTVAGATDWIVVLQTLGQRRQDLYAAPDTSRIPTVCGDQSQCADQLNVQIGDLANKGWKVNGADPYVVLSATVEKFDGGDLETSLLVTVVAVIQRPAEAGTIVDSSGAVVADVEAQTTPGHNAQGRFLLARVGPAEDPWRLVSQDTLPEVPA